MIKMLENSQRVMAGTDSALSPPPPPFHPPSLFSQCQLSVMSVSLLMMLLQSSVRSDTSVMPKYLSVRM